VPPSQVADSERWKAEQGRVWGAGAWEQVADAVLAPVHDEVVAQLDPQPGERWLDLATGTGAVALRAARAGARVSAQDLAPALVERAQRRAEEAGLAVDFAVGDAEELPYAVASFDVVSSVHGVVFAVDHAAVAAEIARVCRPGGRLGLTYWLPNPELAALMERVGYQRPPGAGRPRDWADRGYVRGLLSGAFELAFTEGVCHWRAASGEASWQLFTRGDGPAKVGVAAMSPTERDALRRDWVGYFERHRHGDGVSVPRPFLLIRGVRRPAGGAA
jgi:SAM-dependent methyltransferase